MMEPCNSQIILRMNSKCEQNLQGMGMMTLRKLGPCGVQRVFCRDDWGAGTGLKEKAADIFEQY